MSKNPHLEAYQAIYATTTRVSAGGREKARYYVSNAIKSACWACLNQHESSTCTQKRCYRCAKPGHEVAQCQATEYCGFCGQAGHMSANQCFRQVYNMGLDPRQHEEVQCMVCGEMGHINCKPLPNHSGSYSRKRHRQ